MLLTAPQSIRNVIEECMYNLVKESTCTSDNHNYVTGKNSCLRKYMEAFHSSLKCEVLTHSSEYILYHCFSFTASPFTEPCSGLNTWWIHNDTKLQTFSVDVFLKLACERVEQFLSDLSTSFWNPIEVSVKYVGVIWFFPPSKFSNFN